MPEGRTHTPGTRPRSRDAERHWPYILQARRDRAWRRPTPRADARADRGRAPGPGLTEAQAHAASRVSTDGVKSRRRRNLYRGGCRYASHAACRDPCRFDRRSRRLDRFDAAGAGGVVRPDSDAAELPGPGADRPDGARLRARLAGGDRRRGRPVRAGGRHCQPAGRQRGSRDVLERTPSALRAGRDARARDARRPGGDPRCDPTPARPRTPPPRPPGSPRTPRRSSG